jgi:hypothetical protein
MPVNAGLPASLEKLHITIKSEYSGDAAVNETISLKWSTGTFGNMDTYTWQQSSVLNKPGQADNTQLDIERSNQSMTWQLKRSSSTFPGVFTVDDHSITKPPFSSDSLIPFSPLVLPKGGYW